MHRAVLVGGLALASLAAAAATEAADGVRPGKWEYTITTQMPAMPQMPQRPPGVQLPPNVQMRTGGVSATHTSCVTASDPAGELAKPRGPNAAQSRCNVERMNRSGGTLSWVTSCATPDGASRSEGSARYDGEHMEATTKTRTTHRGGGPPLEVSNHIVGRYLGPCDGR
jgi:hypothetical protein